MSKPKTLKTATDYRPALLWLMGQLERATTSEALAEFERLLGDLIPPAHRGETRSGKIKWDRYVRRSRMDLQNAGLMGSGGRGVWTITPQGQQWLAEHPDGGGGELKALLKPVNKDKAPRTAAARPASGRSLFIPHGELPVARIPGGGDQYLPLEEPVGVVQL
jgi:hypothetical protein